MQQPRRERSVLTASRPRNHFSPLSIDVLCGERTRCHNVASGRVQQSNRRLDRGGRQMHVPLSRDEITVPSEFLNSASRAALY